MARKWESLASWLLSLYDARNTREKLRKVPALYEDRSAQPTQSAIGPGPGLRLAALPGAICE
jgi:hypothetical protein